MSIENLSDEAKSVMLAKAMGWTIENRAGCVVGWRYSDSSDWQRVTDHIPVPNLYDPAFMSLAWRVLNWGLTAREPGSVHAWDAAHNRLGREVMYPGEHGRCTLVGLMSYPPADAQRAFLDKILSLAIDAGLVGENDDQDSTEDVLPLRKPQGKEVPAIHATLRPGEDANLREEI